MVCSVLKKTPIKVNPSFDFSKITSLDIELNHSVVSAEFWSYIAINLISVGLGIA